MPWAPLRRSSRCPRRPNHSARTPRWGPRPPAPGPSAKEDLKGLALCSTPTGARPSFERHAALTSAMIFPTVSFEPGSAAAPPCERAEAELPIASVSDAPSFCVPADGRPADAPHRHCDSAMPASRGLTKPRRWNDRAGMFAGDATESSGAPLTERLQHVLAVLHMVLAQPRRLDLKRFVRGRRSLRPTLATRGDVRNKGDERAFLRRCHPSSAANAEMHHDHQ